MNIIIIIILSILVVTGVVFTLYFRSRASKADTYKSLYKKELAKNKPAEEQNKILAEQEKLKKSLEITIENYKKIESDLNTSIAAKMEELRRKDEMIAAKQSKLDDFNELEKSLQEIELEKEKIKEEIELLIEEKKVEKESLEESIERLRQLNKDAVLATEKDTNDGLWDLFIRDKDKELIKVLEQIKNDYPDLKVDIATIEWKKIWLPKLQDLSNRKGLEKRGIYRLVLKEDENICYVGQATNIKERWYEHAKKMIGVAAKGTEKLYDYRPEDFY